MVHYPTDVIAGAIVGTIGGIIAYFITLGIYRVLQNNAERKFFRFALEFDVIELFKRKKKDN
jgi:membrane-associated phospholipid phosphatase